MGRRSSEPKIRTQIKIPTIELFAGAGGLGLGAHWAGAKVQIMVECDETACQTLTANPQYHSGQILQEPVEALKGTDLRRMAGITRTDPLLVIGGPPCQPFSKAAYWLDSGEEAEYRRARARGVKTERPAAPMVARPDPRRSLLGEFWRLVRESRCDAFVLENVPSILHPRNRPEFEAFIRTAEASGFLTTLVRANAIDFGVPQRRIRVFLIASKAKKPPAPLQTHSETSSLFLAPLVSAGAALKAFSSDSFFEPEEVISGRWAEHLRTIPPGWNYKAHTAWGGHPNPTFETETRFWHFLLKLSPDLPSWTIAATPGPWTGPFHWDNRRLRTVELAALQSFPSDYRFKGNRREQVRQIGNAVPPLMARRVIESVLSTLGNHTVEGDEVDVYPKNELSEPVLGMRRA
jgi:DNA (cytosine-5)-methyltransferase 1